MNKVVIITGQTASGKSDYALDLALKIGGHIINSDAIQVYKETPILSSSPTKYQEIHHLYNIINGNESFSIKQWIDLVLKEIENSITKNLTPIIVGGSPMYNRLLIDGIDEIPDISDETKNKTSQLSQDEIYENLIKNDPLSINIEKNNTHRVLRAYQVLLQTGKSIHSFYKIEKISPLKNYILDKRLISITKEKLHENCQKRFIKMTENGAINEVKNLYEKNYNNNAMIFKTIGILEIKQYIDGIIGLEKAIELSVIKTKQYAKKQATWFNNKFSDFILT